MPASAEATHRTYRWAMRPAERKSATPWTYFCALMAVTMTTMMGMAKRIQSIQCMAEGEGRWRETGEVGGRIAHGAERGKPGKRGTHAFAAGPAPE